MVAQTVPAGRQKGNIRKRGNSYQVRVYAGDDPLTGRPHYLTESTRDRKQAERILRRLLTEVDEQGATRTKATLASALDAWLRVHDGEANTRRGYEANVRRYIGPALGDVPLGKITAHLLEAAPAEPIASPTPGVRVWAGTGCTQGRSAGASGHT